MLDTTHMDNPQVNIANLKAVAWVAGIIDGEGCFMAHRQSSSKSYDRYFPTIAVDMQNNGKVTMEKFAKTLNDNGIGCHVKEVKRNGKLSYCVTISGYKRVKKTCELLRDDLTTKQADLMAMEYWVNTRLTLNRYAPYTDGELACIMSLRNRYADTSTTTRLADPTAV